MVIDQILERFVQACPATAMTRATLQKVLEASWVDRLFAEFRERQYTRELLFSTTVELMSVVALGLKPSIHLAAQARQDLSVSLAALHDKINGTEIGLSRALVVGSEEPQNFQSITKNPSLPYRCDFEFFRHRIGHLTGYPDLQGHK